MQRNNRHDTETVLRLIGYCKSNNLNALRRHLAATPFDMFITAPVPMLRFDEDKGLLVEPLEINLITYCFLHADLEAFTCIRSKVGDHMMGKFAEAIILAINNLPPNFTSMYTLHQLVEAVEGILKDKKNQKQLPKIMTCLPPYIMHALCNSSWSFETRKDKLRGTRDEPTETKVYKDKRNQVNLTDVLWRPKGKKSVSYATICRGSHPSFIDLPIITPKNKLIDHEVIPKLTYDAGLIRHTLSAHMRVLLISALKVAEYAAATRKITREAYEQFSKDLVDHNKNPFLKYFFINCPEDVKSWRELAEALEECHGVNIPIPEEAPLAAEPAHSVQPSGNYPSNDNYVAPTNKIKETETVERLVDFCKSNNLDALRRHLTIRPHDAFIIAPVPMIRSDERKGHIRERLKINLVSYCFLHADLEAFNCIRTSVPEEMVGQLATAIMDATYHYSLEFSSLKTLERYIKAVVLGASNSKDRNLVPQLMACLPPYVLYELCASSWTTESLISEVKGFRDTPRHPTVSHPKAKMGVNLTSIFWKPAGNKSVTCELLYRGRESYNASTLPENRLLDIEVKMKMTHDARMINLRIIAHMSVLVEMAYRVVMHADSIGKLSSGLCQQYFIDLLTDGKVPFLNYYLTNMKFKNPLTEPLFEALYESYQMNAQRMPGAPSQSEQLRALLTSRLKSTRTPAVIPAPGPAPLAARGIIPASPSPSAPRKAAQSTPSPLVPRKVVPSAPSPLAPRKVAQSTSSPLAPRKVAQSTSSPLAPRKIAPPAKQAPRPPLRPQGNIGANRVPEPHVPQTVTLPRQAVKRLSAQPAPSAPRAAPAHYDAVFFKQPLRVRVDGASAPPAPRGIQLHEH